MITSSFGTFFWLISGYIYLFKYKSQMSAYFDLVFLAIIIMFMYQENLIMVRQQGVILNLQILKIYLKKLNPR